MLTWENVVDLLTHYSNRPDLLQDLTLCLEQVRRCRPETPQPVLSASVHSDRVPRTNWRVKDRVTSEDIDTLCAFYQAGASVQELAERYKISWSSVKTLLREWGVKRPAEYDGRRWRR
jgi:hypothetical protein